MVPPVVFDPMSESIPVAVLASGAVAGTPAATTAVSEAEAFEEAVAFPMLDPETSSIAESSMSESRTAPESGSESSPAVAVVVPAAMEPAATAAPSVERPRPAALQPTAQAQPAPIPDRPAVVIHAPAPAAPAAPAAEITGPTRPPRPRTVVRSAGVEPAAEGSVAARIAPLAASATPQDESSRGRAPEFVLAAPIEMWFGEHRVGVKAGTRTYEQFRRYADTLFEDLKAADNR
jgi:hypothetical protein